MILTIELKPNDFWGNSFVFQGFTDGLVNVNGKPSKGVTFQKNYMYVSQDTKEECIEYLYTHKDVCCDTQYSQVKLNQTLKHIKHLTR